MGHPMLASGVGVALGQDWPPVTTAFPQQPFPHMYAELQRGVCLGKCDWDYKSGTGKVAVIPD